MGRSNLRHGLTIGAVAAVLALALWFGGLLNGWENTTWTWRVRALARPGASTDQVALILLDQNSLDWGREFNDLSWPWPREVYAPILDFCGRAGSKAVAFDVLFTEPSVYGVWDDQALGDAITRNGAFVGALFLSIDEHAQDDSRATDPIPDVRENAALMANVSDVPDPDGVFRRAGLWRRRDGDPVPSLGMGAWLVGTGREAPDAPRAEALLRFRGPPSVYNPLSAASIIQSELLLLEGETPTVSPDALRDKYVLFGFSAPGLLDLRPTPISRVTPGVFIHATTLDNLLSDDFMREAAPAAVAAGTLLLALLSGLVVVGLTGTARTLLASLGLLVLPLALGFAAYGPGWWWPVIPGTIATAGALFGGMVRNYAVEGRQRRFIKSAFRHYLSPAVIEKILVDPNALSLGGERRELSILFSDLAGFTSLSEGMEPEALTTLLNEYLSDMTDIILEEGGTLDKYEGDAILAFWNAPLAQADHAARACRAAVRCQAQLAARRGEFRERCGSDMYMRIGIHTGDVIVGNMGSRQRFDYTIIGDAANLASRLEGANKVFGSWIMVSDATLAAANAASDAPYVSRELGELRVVGRKEPVLVHELAALPGDPEPAVYAPYARALDRCRAGDLEAAAAAFSDLAGDPPSAAYRTRCKAAIEARDPFTGLWNLVNK